MSHRSRDYSTGYQQGRDDEHEICMQEFDDFEARTDARTRTLNALFLCLGVILGVSATLIAMAN